jgi:nitroimidazol reductase NimA-like FMN-containing flavoprotein (pyridoxamine 5'-phosphate oxidase superfamily)
MTRVPVRLSAPQETFLRWARVARVATLSPDGMPHVVPICPLLHQGKVYFATPGSSRKARNLVSDPRISLAFDDYVEDWDGLRGLTIQGRARLLRRGNRWRELRDLFNEKYPQYPIVSPIVDGDVIVEVTIDRLLGEV